METAKGLIGILLLTLITITGCRNKSEKSAASVPRLPAEDGRIDSVLNISIHEASLNGQLSAVLYLLEKGSDINAPDQDGRTALIYAAYNGHTEIVKKLIEKGADVNLRDNYGRTALMMAASGAFPETVRLLLDHSADPDITDKEEHFTALMYAAAEGQLEVVKILLIYRADPSLKDIDGDDARTFAERNGHKEISALLKSFRK